MQTLQPIEKGARRAVIAASLAIVTCGLLVAPLVGAPSSGLPYQRKPGETTPRTSHDDPWNAAPVVVLRDPFLVTASATPAPTPSSVSARNADAGAAEGLPFVPATGVDTLIRAIVAGNTSKALIEEGASTRIVAPGDLIHGKKIEAILSDRIVLTGGAVLVLPGTLP